MKTYRCPNCLKEVEAEIILRAKCKECKCIMNVVKEKPKPKELERKYSGSFYVSDNTRGQAFCVNGKLAYGTPSKDSGLLNSLKSAFARGYGGDVK